MVLWTLPINIHKYLLFSVGGLISSCITTLLSLSEPGTPYTLMYMYTQWLDLRGNSFRNSVSKAVSLSEKMYIYIRMILHNSITQDTSVLITNILQINPINTFIITIISILSSFSGYWFVLYQPLSPPSQNNMPFLQQNLALYTKCSIRQYFIDPEPNFLRGALLSKSLMYSLIIFKILKILKT